MMKTLKRWNVKEWLFFFLIIPLILIIIYLLPQSTKDIFILKTQHPTLVSIFLSNYTHSTSDHFWNNLFSYLIVMFLIFIINTNKKIFYSISLLNFIVVPIISSLLTIFIILFSSSGPRSSQGFSAIVLAFIGYLPFSLFNYFKKLYPQEISFRFFKFFPCITFICMSFTCMGWIYYNTAEISIYYKILFPVCSIGLTILSIYLIYTTKKEIKNVLKSITLKYFCFYNQKFSFWKMAMNAFVNIGFVIMFIIFLFPFWVIFPHQLIIEGGCINIYAHFIGYCFGAFVPFIFKLDKRRKEVPQS